MTSNSFTMHVIVMNKQSDDLLAHILCAHLCSILCLLGNMNRLLIGCFVGMIAIHLLLAGRIRHNPLWWQTEKNQNHMSILTQLISHQLPTLLMRFVKGSQPIQLIHLLYLQINLLIKRTSGVDRCSRGGHPISEFKLFPIFPQ